MAQLNCLWFDDENPIVWVMYFTIRERIRYWATELSSSQRNQMEILTLELRAKLNTCFKHTRWNQWAEIIRLQWKQKFIQKKERKKKKGNFSPKTRNKPIHHIFESDTCLWRNLEELHTLTEKVIFSLLKTW